MSHGACVTRKPRIVSTPSLIYISLIAVIPSDSLSSAASADVPLIGRPRLPRYHAAHGRVASGGTETNRHVENNVRNLITDRGGRG